MEIKTKMFKSHQHNKKNNMLLYLFENTYCDSLS